MGAVASGSAVVAVVDEVGGVAAAAAAAAAAVDVRRPITRHTREVRRIWL